MSWCLADVQKLHGDINLQSRDGEFNDADTTVIYPDADPTGKVDAGKQGLGNPSLINPGDTAPPPGTGTGPVLNPGKGPGPNVPPPGKLPEFPDFQRTPKVNDGAKTGGAKSKAKPASTGGVKGFAKSIRSRFEPTPAEQGEPTPAPPIQSTYSASMIQPTSAAQPMPLPASAGQASAASMNNGRFAPNQQSPTYPPVQQQQPLQPQPLPQQPLREPVPHVWPENPAFDPEEEYLPRGQVRPAASTSVPRSPPAGQRAYYEWQDGPQR
jgi:hypothetical protein